ncbi:hypothetical protein [Aureimonas glaciei]|uniref:Nucleoside-diphosphate kinase n=1 Tax=Aureimonas glaciei TaxID=1776957 RepID=A0A917DGU1_9HYPH|nr:hypothetical protein [Aureimonas glaciei]GGD37167.1 nucleoside-diphosphate kinase [Aureimonas glaciei]
MYAEKRHLLSSKDHTTLECLLNRAISTGDNLAGLIRRKLANAIITFPSDVPPNVAVIGSLAAYRFGDGEIAVKRLVDGTKDEAPDGEASVSTPLGLALLGMTEGETASFFDADGSLRVLHLDEVRNHGEAIASRDAVRGPFPSYMRRNMRPVPGQSLVDFASRHQSRARFPGFMNDDDPGPSAA